MTTSNKNFKVKNGLDVSGEITSLNSNGLEGGQINLAKPGTTNLSGDIAIDIYENKIRFFDKGGSARGAYIDLSSAAEMVGTNLLAASGNGGPLNYAQTLGTKQSAISASGTSIVSVSITTNGYPILVSATGDVENNSIGGWTVLQLYRGSTAIGNTVHTEGSAASENVPYALHVIDTPAAGTHTYHLKLNSAAGGTFNFGESTGPVITAVELSGPKGDAGADGAPGVDGAPGIDGTDGAPGAGVATGGTAGQILSKVDGTDYNTQWVDNQTTLNGLTDVDTTGVADGDALVYDDATGTWIPGAGGGSGSAVIMSDTKPVITGDGLEWHDTTDGTDYVSVGGVWVAQSSGVNLSSAADVRLTNAEANITDLEQQVRPVILGGTGATTAAGARTNLDAAQTAHVHAASDITSGALVHDRMPSGSVVQVVQVVKTNTFASSAGAVWGDIPGMLATITPKFATSKLFVMVDVKAAGTNDNSICKIKMQRSINAGAYSDVYVGDAASNRPRAMSEFYMASGGGPYYMAQMGGNYLDSPATTSSVSYKLQIGGDGNANILYVNRTQGDRDGAYMDARGVSSITIMEIAG